MELMVEVMEQLTDIPVFRYGIHLAFVFTVLKTGFNLLFCCNLSGTYNDNVNVKQEEIKETEVVSAKISLDNLSGYWTCPYCDGLNKKKHLICTHCAAPRRE